MNKTYLTILIYGLAVIILLLANDKLVSFNLDNLNIIKLKNQSEESLLNVDNKIVELEKSIKSLSEKIDIQKGIDYPTLNNIKQLSTNNSLQFIRMEKTNDTKLNNKNYWSYYSSFNGSITNIINFLKKLEDNYIFSCDRLLLTPYNENGEIITLHMNFMIKPDDQ